MHTVITDPGVDDLVALALLNKLDPDKNSLITSFGNVPLEFTDQNAREFIAQSVPHWNYYKGSKKALNGKQNAKWAAFFHGKDGSWGVHPKVGSAKLNALKGYPKNENVISLGPFTDLVKLQKKVSINKVMVMGGAFNVAGNETKYSEFNAAADPEAVSEFFKNAKGVNVSVVSLDGTGKTTWPLFMVKGIPETNKTNILLKKLLLAWFEGFKDKNAFFELYDPLAVYLNFFPKDAKWVKGDVEVILRGKKRGKTVLKKNERSSVKVAVEIPNPKLVGQKIFDLIFN